MQRLAQNVMYAPHWQLIRVQLMGNWAKKPSTNVHKCKVYLGDHRDVTKVWRVLNLLNAVRMGFHGQGLVGSDADNTILAFRNEMSEVYANLRASGAQLEEVTEAQVLEEWSQIPEYWQIIIKNDLLLRYVGSSKSKNRNDLKWFLELIGVKYNV